MVNQAIYNTALTKAQIQQLFQFGKGLAAPDFPWQNPDNPLDVDGNGVIQNVDLLQVINRLIALGITDLSPPSEGTSPPPYIDTSGNNHLEPLDALRIVNYLIANPPGGSGSAQATALATSLATEAANQANFATVAATPAAAAAASTPAAEPANIGFALPSSLTANTPPLAGAADLTVMSQAIAAAPARASAAVVNVSAFICQRQAARSRRRRRAVVADLALDALRRDDFEEDFELECDLLDD